MSIAVKRERANAEKKAEILQKQGEKMRAKASKATAAQGMLRRAEKLRSSLDDVRVKDIGGKASLSNSITMWEDANFCT